MMFIERLPSIARTALDAAPTTPLRVEPTTGTIDTTYFVI